MKVHAAENVRIFLPREVLTAIFDECDRFEHDETGGRVIGSFKEHDGELTLYVAGVIEAGPGARRTPVSFFQDGEHQERVFRQIERDHPEIEHLGNWHTHHVNGLSTLSDGDIPTYQRIVNHNKHNTSFFYALLVTAKHRTSNPLRRYSVKHYLIRRGDERVYEVAPPRVEIINGPIVWPAPERHAGREVPREFARLGERVGRIYDRDIIGEFYQGFRPFASPKIGLYWRGFLELLDGTSLHVVLLEDATVPVSAYSVALPEAPGHLKPIAEELGQMAFPSARAALITTERTCNRFLYQQRCHSGRTDSLS